MEQNEVRSAIADVRDSSDVLGITTAFNGGLTLAEFFHVGAVLGATWRFGGRSDNPHAVTKHGVHTDTIINFEKILVFSNLREIFAKMLASRLDAQKIEPKWVVGPQDIALFVGDMGRHMKARSNFAERRILANRESSVLTWTGGAIPSEDVVLVVSEDAVPAQIGAVLLAVNRYHVLGRTPDFLPFVGTIINSTGHDIIGYQRLQVVSIYDVVCRRWRPDMCELCEMGSPALTYGNLFARPTKNR